MNFKDALALQPTRHTVKIDMFRSKQLLLVSDEPNIPHERIFTYEIHLSYLNSSLA